VNQRNCTDKSGPLTNEFERVPISYNSAARRPTQLRKVGLPRREVVVLAFHPVEIWLVGQGVT